MAGNLDRPSTGTTRNRGLGRRATALLLSWVMPATTVWAAAPPVVVGAAGRPGPLPRLFRSLAADPPVARSAPGGPAYEPRVEPVVAAAMGGPGPEALAPEPLAPAPLAPAPEPLGAPAGSPPPPP
ncbi:MAG TPA: hypothetical protein VLI67_06520, partial [Vicinamibacteria bacterium]|nr:hypothetical protein [Vicinamibacteria bacterium]